MKHNISNLVVNLANQKVTRKLLLPNLEKELYKGIFNNKPREIESIKKKKYAWTKALLASAIRNIDKGYISSQMLNRLSKALIKGAFHEDQKNLRAHLQDFSEKYGVDAPNFFVISPTKQCNLNCKGCYASSNSKTSPKLPYSRLKQLIREFHEEAYGRFIVISGGEPLMYKSEGKTLIDLAREFPDIFFMFYTNGTFINNRMARSLAEIGNLIPSISVEGFEKETDERRGKGVFQKVVNGMAALRNNGVPFAMSVTVTSQNTDLLLSDEFYDYFFEEQGATYMWQFQLMPIGRGKEIFNLMPTPEQRLKLYRKWEYLLEEKQYCVVDFWNSGILTDGCIAYGRKGGYLYFDWHGNVMPCVFVPYVVDNFIRAQDEGRNLASILKAPMLVNGRKWQKNYSLDKLHKPNNMLMPCSIRDHFDNFMKNIITSDNSGEDKVAESILHDKHYYNRMVNYDKKLKSLTEEIWNKEYLKKTE